MLAEVGFSKNSYFYFLFSPTLKISESILLLIQGFFFSSILEQINNTAQEYGEGNRQELSLPHQIIHSGNLFWE